jgi:hypothetical protein
MITNLTSPSTIPTTADKGIVVETIDTGKMVWINTREKPQFGEYCAIYVERTAQSRCVSEGDTIEWKDGEYAAWTPRDRFGRIYSETEVKLKITGFAVAERPYIEK